MNRYHFFFIGLLIADVVSAMTGRLAFNAQSTFFMLVSMVSLSAIGYFLIRLMQESVGIVLNVVTIALGAINVTVFSFLFFGEKITLFQGLGMTVILVGLILTKVYAPKESLGAIMPLALKGLQMEVSTQFRLKLKAVFA